MEIIGLPRAALKEIREIPDIRKLAKAGVRALCYMVDFSKKELAMSRIYLVLLAILFFLTIGILVPSAAAEPSAAPYRIYDSAQKRFVSFKTLTFRLAVSDIVFLGEQHDSSSAHRMELAILKGIASRRMNVLLALEMFERDVQPILDQYLSGNVSEAEFLAASRPWRNYITDYRPLVEFAKAKKLPVLASNIPQYLDATIAHSGITALTAVDPDERKSAAADIICPRDAYFRRFVAAMKDMGLGGSAHPMRGSQMLYLYQAQCARDETMAESVTRAWKPGRLIVHVNGAFHSDFGLGTVARTKQRAQRAPRARVRTVSILPEQTPGDLQPSKKERRRADYLIYVSKPNAPTL